MGYSRKHVAINPSSTNLTGQSYSALPNLVSGREYRFPNGTLSTSAALGIGTMRLIPKFFPNAVTLDRLGAEVQIVGEAGSKFRLGIYADDGTFRPGALILDAGVIAGDSATTQNLTISQAIPRGWVWFAGVVQVVVTTQPTMRTLATLMENVPVDFVAGVTAGIQSYGASQTGVTGALPANATPSAGTGSIPAIHGRVA